MMVYHPQDKLTFGKNKGYTLAEIYQYQPDYIEWLMQYVPSFLIEISEFEKLPKPTPYAGNVSIDAINLKIKPFGPNAIKALIEAKGKEKYEVDFTFSEIFRKILEQKLKGEYVTPEYKKSGIGNWDVSTFIISRQEEFRFKSVAIAYLLFLF